MRIIQSVGFTYGCAVQAQTYWEKKASAVKTEVVALQLRQAEEAGGASTGRGKRQKTQSRGSSGMKQIPRHPCTSTGLGSSSLQILKQDNYMSGV